MLLLLALLAQDTVPARPARPDTLGDLVVSVTRTTRRVEAEPTRMEVLGREEIEEKLLMTPGDISMLLNESSGLRVQNTSPSLGGANLRVQGLRGRYTRILQDGLPLAGTQAGSLGLLQIPPMDLGRVEVVKGVASPFYGGSALGGVVNLVSRAPEGREVLLNQTTRGGTDAVLWTAGPEGGGWRSSLLAGLHRQERRDLDRDGWTDVPGYRRAVARPRVYWQDESGRSLFVTSGLTLEAREGGTLRARTAPDGAPFPERLDSRNVDLGVIGRLVPRFGVVTARLAATAQRHDQVRGAAREVDHHLTLFAELTATVTAGPGAMVAGIVWDVDRYRNRDAPGHEYTFSTPGLLLQYDWDPSERVGATVTGRVDHHSLYGAFASPRAALRIGLAGSWAFRASGGLGYFAPTPFVEETEAIGLARLVPAGALRAERMAGGSLDVGGWVGPVELNASLFRSHLRHPVILRDGPASGMVHLANAPEPTRTAGVELLARAHLGDVAATLTYTGLRATEQMPEGTERRTVPLNPAHAAGLVVVWEQEERGRLGVEAFLTGPQHLEANPFRTRTPTYLVLGLLAERRVGPARLFLNLENLTDRRQTRWDPLVRPHRLPDGRWTVDLWAPADGRVVNGGVRLEW
jgi:outer membrane receptor for ferrienterochelin and colicins